MAMQVRNWFSEVLKEYDAIVENLWNKDKEGVLEALNIHLTNTQLTLVSKLGCGNSRTL